jgi:hypothetical protein
VIQPNIIIDVPVGMQRRVVGANRKPVDFSVLKMPDKSKSCTESALYIPVAYDYFVPWSNTGTPKCGKAVLVEERK